MMHEQFHHTQSLVTNSNNNSYNDICRWASIIIAGPSSCRRTMSYLSLLFYLTLSLLTNKEHCERESITAVCVCMREHYDVSCTPACMYVSTARSFFTDRDREEFDTIKMTNLYDILFK